MKTPDYNRAMTEVASVPRGMAVSEAVVEACTQILAIEPDAKGPMVNIVMDKQVTSIITTFEGEPKLAIAYLLGMLGVTMLDRERLRGDLYGNARSQ